MFTEEELTNLEYCIGLTISDLERDCIKVTAFGHIPKISTDKINELYALREKVRKI